MKYSKTFLGYPKEITWKGQRFWLCFRRWSGTPYWYRGAGSSKGGGVRIVNRWRRLCWVVSSEWYHRRFDHWGELARARETMANARKIKRAER